MDMPIDQINSRLFARLPADPGLGLLFAVGTVGQIVYASGRRPIQFTLREAGYALRCKVAPDVTPDLELAEGQRVRATGHLSFSAQSAQFHLAVRELELLPDSALAGSEASPPREPRPASPAVVPDWLTGIQRRAQAAPPRLVPADLPDWVRALAPPSAETPAAAGADRSWGVRRAGGELEKVPAPAGTQAALELAAGPRLDDNQALLAFLFDALERSEREDVELTAESLAQFGPMPAEKSRRPIRPAAVRSMPRGPAPWWGRLPAGWIIWAAILAVVLLGAALVWALLVGLW